MNMLGGRCLVLNASYEYLHVTNSWWDSVKLILMGKATALADYPVVARSERVEVPVPAVVVLKRFIPTPRKAGVFNAPTKRNVLVRDGFACAYCGRRLSMNTVTKDHVMPRSRGGQDTMGNVVAACLPCNGTKANKTPAEAGMTLRVTPRSLTEAEKMELIAKTHKSNERQAWRECLDSHEIKLFG